MGNTAVKIWMCKSEDFEKNNLHALTLIIKAKAHGVDSLLIVFTMTTLPNHRQLSGTTTSDI